MITEKVKERQILFRGDLVRAILEGRKTMTRRPVPLLMKSESWRKYAEWEASQPLPRPLIDRCLDVYRPGDRLWVRHDWWEKFKGTYNHQALNEYTKEVVWKRGGHIVAGIDGFPKADWKHKPSIHMPRWASRITLEITSVRVERIQDISEADAMAEGIGEFGEGAVDADFGPTTPVRAFQECWNATYPGSWDRNDWVWVIEFKKI